jgi:dephospho-CoA kinase
MSNAILTIGLTGGIGSGKSEVSRRFEEKGITVVDADVVAREVVEPATDGLVSIQQHFGDAILLPDGSLDRKQLRDIIFNDPNEKKWLESLLHPMIHAAIKSQLRQASGSYVILSSPLLFETHQHKLVDRILVVDTSESIQIERASSRDGNNSEQIKAIMATQLTRQERCARANDIIHNHKNLSDLDEQVNKLHSLYLKISETYPHS